LVISQSIIAFSDFNLIEHFSLAISVITMGALRRALLQLAFYILVLFIGYFLLKAKRLQHLRSKTSPVGNDIY
jgi:hypothetical protein